MLKEEAMVIKENLQDSSLDQFRASDRRLYTWKSAFAIKERRIVTSWMERIQELTEVYSSENIWNMDESVVFLSICMTKDCLKKAKKRRVAKHPSKDSL